MKKILSLLLAVALVGGCGGSQNAVKPSPDDSRECARNFSYDGSFLSGRTFKDHVFVKGVTQTEAMKRAARYIASDGWHISTTNEKLGIISASQTVSFGEGKTAPLNVGFEQVKGGVNLTMSYAISGGVTSPVDAVQKFFCSVTEAVQNK